MAMLNLFRAEWKKITGNRMLAFFTIWIYPLGLGAFLVFVNLVALLRLEAIETMGVDLPLQWTNMMLSVWNILNRYEYFMMLGLPMMAFLAVYFAGEYEWDTWKNIVPRSRRVALILSKTLVLVSAVLVSLMLTSLVSCIGWGTAALIEGYDYGPALTAEVFAEFAGKYLFEAVVSAGYLLVLVGFATLAALRTRTVVGGLIVSYLLAMIELMSPFLFQLFASLFSRPEIASLARFIPSYSMRNIRFWVLDGMAFPLPGKDGAIIEPELGFSVAVLVAWIVGLLALNLYLFQKQDLTS